MAATIAQWRALRGLTQLELAHAAGLSPQVISRMENGKAVSRTSFRLVLSALNITLNDVQGVTIQRHIKVESLPTMERNEHDQN